MFNILLTRNDAKYRLARTIVQGIIGVLIANLDVIIGGFDIPVTAKPIIASLVMAVLAPVMQMMGTYEMPEKEDLPETYFEGGEE